jgi:hypothetical protein
MSALVRHEETHAPQQLPCYLLTSVASAARNATPFGSNLLGTRDWRSISCGAGSTSKTRSGSGLPVVEQDQPDDYEGEGPDP